jgi:hypothetical protein
MSNLSPDQLAAMLERLNFLESSRPAPESPLPSAPLPDKYDVSRKTFRSFICQLELVFRVDPRYREDKVKIAILGTLLEGGAMASFTPYLEHADQHEALLSDYSQFRKLFLSVFGDTDRVALASSRLRDLGQGRRPALAYASDFRELAADLQWNDAAFIDQFRAGLSEQIQDLLLHYPPPSQLKDFINLVMTLDNRVYEHNKRRLTLISNPLSYLFVRWFGYFLCISVHPALLKSLITSVSALSHSRAHRSIVSLTITTRARVQSRDSPRRPYA